MCIQCNCMPMQNWKTSQIRSFTFTFCTPCCKHLSRTQYNTCFWCSVYISIYVPPEDVVYCPQMTMPPHPATDASELAKFEPLKHGFHEKPAFVLEELESL